MGGDEPTTCRTGRRTACTRSTATGTRCSPSTTATASCAPRPGSTRCRSWPTGCAPTRCTRPSTSPTSRRRGRPTTLRTVIDESLAAFGAVGAPSTWVLSNHDVVRHATPPRAHRREPAGPRHRPEVAPACPIAELGLRRARAATALMLALPGSRLPLPGRGARPARGHRPARRRPPGPDLVPHQRRALRPRRMPRADPVGGGRPRLRLQPHRRQLAAAARRVGALRPRRAGGGPGSTLELYAGRCALRREHGLGARRARVARRLRPRRGRVPQRRRDRADELRQGAARAAGRCHVCCCRSEPLAGSTVPQDVTVWLLTAD